jgi:hypothetical protein
MDKMSGIYIELVFLDGFLNFGQGIFTFAIFGLDAKYVLMPIQNWLRRQCYGQDHLVLPNWEDLDEETKHHCQQFLKHHISNCMQTLVRDVRYVYNTHHAEGLIDPNSQYKKTVTGFRYPRACRFRKYQFENRS